MNSKLYNEETDIESAQQKIQNSYHCFVGIPSVASRHLWQESRPASVTSGHTPTHINAPYPPFLHGAPAFLFIAVNK